MGVRGELSEDQRSSYAAHEVGTMPTLHLPDSKRLRALQIRRIHQSHRVPSVRRATGSCFGE
jgi:hypothetical protein